MDGILKNKTMLIISFWGYPFGGGEEYLYQTAIWSSQYKMRTYWLCFSNANNKPYHELEISDIDGFKLIKVPGGLTSTVLYNWIRLINPDIVHHQGHLRKLFYTEIAKFRVPFITGVHFWNGVISLNQEYKNIDIIENADKHSPDPEFIELREEPFCYYYSVSKYVTEAVKQISGYQIMDLAYSGSSKLKCLIDNINPIKNKYITIINIHKMKGGDLILFLLQKLLTISFLVIRTEYHSEDLDKQILDIINWRNENGHAPSLFLERTNDIKFIYSQTKIFLAPSIVDETFCRTVNEAMMNGIPVFTSGQGNLKYLVNDESVININDSQKWLDKINELYFNDQLYTEMANRTKEKYLEYSEEVCKNMFFNIISRELSKSKTYNLMIMAPWCDQGLGIQARNYYNILKDTYRIFIFSIKPYSANSALEMQKDPTEWLGPEIYYSPNDREHVKDSEITNFVKKYNIGKCIIPETCWFRTFEVAKLFRTLYVKCYAVPNIEIVRKDEIAKHKYFHKILCNNQLCQTIFNEYNIHNTEYIGYGIENMYNHKKRNTITKFLFIGGMNAFSRKHILEICEGFVKAYQQNNNISLTCTIQKTNLLEVDDINKLTTYLDHPAITFIQTHLKYDDIINLYYDHHVSIQLSKHEGLGLGFYEGLATGTPIITLNTPPHNEIIKDNVNGWLIDCYYQEMTDNPNSFIKSAYFNPELLSSKMLEIIPKLSEITRTLMFDYNKRLNLNIFKKQFISSLDD